MPILTAISAMAFLGLVLSAVLGLAAKVFYVYVDPRIEQISDALPGANCGGCGYAGCSDYAEAIVNMGTDPNACVAAGASTTEVCCSIMGISAGVGERYVARIFCQGSDEKASKRFAYNGARDCAAAIVSTGGDKDCQYGCIGLGSCVLSCPFDALSLGEEGLPVVNEELCTGCGNCVQTCPRDIPRLIPISQKTANLCSTHDAGKVVKQICSTGCIGCSVCKKKCPEEAISMVDKLAVVDPAMCTGQGVCIEKCPTGSMVSLKPEAQEVRAPRKEAEQEAA